MTGAPGHARRSLRVCFIAVNTFAHDSRTLRAAEALASDGHDVVVVAQPGEGLPTEDVLAGGIRVLRPDVDRRISSAFLLPIGPFREPVRRAVARALRLEVDAVGPTPRGPGRLERIRAPMRRGAEILAYRRRIGSWAATVAAVAPADVYSAKALVALPVARAAAGRTGGRFVYDIADLHVESGRLARMPRPLKSYLIRRERTWMADAAGLTAVTGPLADEVVRRFHVKRPIVLMNCPPRWLAGQPKLPRFGRLRAAIEVAAPTAPRDAPIVLYQGAFREDQGIEELLPALSMPPLRDVPLTMVFLGFGWLEPRLLATAAAMPGRVVVLPVVPSGELLEWTSDADIAFVGAPPKTINLRLTMPNKLFESLMAGVPVLAASGTAVAALVESAGVGSVVSPWTPAAVAEALAAMLAAPPAARAGLRTRARASALERYNAETEHVGLLAMYRGLADGS